MGVLVFPCECVCERGILCLYTRFCLSPGAVGCELCINIWVSGNESGLSEGGFWPLGVHIRSRAYLLVRGDFVHMPPTSTASCFGPHCGAEAMSAMGHRFAAVSD